MLECPNNEPGNLLIQTSPNIILMVEQDSSFGLVVQDFKGEAMEAMCKRVEGILQLCNYCNSGYANENQNYVCIGDGFRRFVVEGDSSLVFKAILEEGGVRSSSANFIQESKECVGAFNGISFHLTKRVVNKAAHLRGTHGDF